jgi:protoporphyrinogen oxidase
MERFYGSAPEEIDIHFAEKRMLWIREHALLRTHLQRFFSRAADRGPSNVQLARPKAGFAALYQPAVDRLRAGGVTFALGARPTRLSRDGERFILEVGEAAFTCGRVVSTIPLDHIRRLCGLGGEAQLDTVTLVTLFYSFAGERGFPQSILYNFSDGGAWKRLTVYSDFYGAAQGREYFAAELNARHVGACAEAGDRDFRAHVAQNGLFDGDLRLEGSHVLDHAYPIYLGGAQARLGETLAELRRFGIESIGRQGAFDYQPTARDTTLKAEAALDWKR